jgi:hydroxymethylglutaryl-CoA lyase
VLRAGLPDEPLYGMTPDAGLTKGFVYADGHHPADERLQSAAGASA